MCECLDQINDLVVDALVTRLLQIFLAHQVRSRFFTQVYPSSQHTKHDDVLHMGFKIRNKNGTDVRSSFDDRTFVPFLLWGKRERMLWVKGAVMVLLYP